MRRICQLERAEAMLNLIRVYLDEEIATTACLFLYYLLIWLACFGLRNTWLLFVLFHQLCAPRFSFVARRTARNRLRPFLFPHSILPVLLRKDEY
jgi:hypothetical protein